jgi:hypothetical protein
MTPVYELTSLFTFSPYKPRHVMFAYSEAFRLETATRCISQPQVVHALFFALSLLSSTNNIQYLTYVKSFTSNCRKGQSSSLNTPCQPLGALIIKHFHPTLPSLKRKKSAYKITTLSKCVSSFKLLKRTTNFRDIWYTYDANQGQLKAIPFDFPQSVTMICGIYELVRWKRD